MLALNHEELNTPETRLLKTSNNQLILAFMHKFNLCCNLNCTLKSWFLVFALNCRKKWAMVTTHSSLSDQYYSHLRMEWIALERTNNCCRHESELELYHCSFVTIERKKSKIHFHNRRVTSFGDFSTELKQFFINDFFSEIVIFSPFFGPKIKYILRWNFLQCIF